MKKSLFVVLFCVFTANLFSQDTIVKKNGEIIIAKILKMSSTEVTYKKFNFQDGPTYIEPKSTLSSIAYYKEARIIYDNNKDDKYYEKREIIISEKVEKEHRLTFSVNFPIIIVNEISLYIDYCKNKRHSIGINIGSIYPNPELQFKNIYMINKSDTPCDVYNGMVSRINYKYYFSDERNQYFSPGFIFESLRYSNVTFTNRDGQGYYFNFTRSETSHVFGADIIYGNHFVRTEKKINIEFFVGLGFRFRIRDYTTTSCDTIYYNPHQPGYQVIPLGTFRYDQTYPILNIGLKIGINTFFK